MALCSCGGQETILGSQILLSIVWILGFELKFSGLVANIINLKSHSIILKLYFYALFIETKLYTKPKTSMINKLLEVKVASPRGDKLDSGGSGNADTCAAFT